MKCPNCGYQKDEYGYNENNEFVKLKDSGFESFFESPIKLVQHGEYYNHDYEASIYGCPDCKLVFIHEGF